MPLARADCEKIHGAALNVLKDLGVRVDDPEIVRLMQNAGATLDSENRVHIPARLVEWALHQAPRQVKIANRNGHLWELGPEGGTLVLTGNALYITRGRVRSDLRADDLGELARIADACPNIHGMVGTSLADYPPPAVTSWAFASWRKIRASICGRASSRRPGHVR